MKNSFLVIILFLNLICDAQKVSQDSLLKKNQQQIADLRNRLNTLNNIGKSNTPENDSIKKLQKVVISQIDTISDLRKEILRLNKKLLMDKYSTNPDLASKEKEQYDDFKNNPFINSKLGTCNCIRVYYGASESDVPYAIYKELDSIAILYKANPKLKLRLDGHADKTGKEAINQALSQKRAQSLRNYLVTKKGFSENNIIIKWHGSEMPSLDASEINQQFLNRRVEVFIE